MTVNSPAGSGTVIEVTIPLAMPPHGLLRELLALKERSEGRKPLEYLIKRDWSPNHRAHGRWSRMDTRGPKVRLGGVNLLTTLANKRHRDSCLWIRLWLGPGGGGVT
jgi:hypothetical protein